MIAGSLESVAVVTLLSEAAGNKFVALYSRPASRMAPVETMSTTYRLETSPLQLRLPLEIDTADIFWGITRVALL